MLYSCSFWITTGRLENITLQLVRNYVSCTQKLGIKCLTGIKCKADVVAATILLELSVIQFLNKKILNKKIQTRIYIRKRRLHSVECILKMK